MSRRTADSSICFNDPQDHNRIDTVRCLFVSYLDDLIRTAATRIAEYGYLNANGCRIERDELDATLHLFDTPSLRKAA